MCENTSNNLISFFPPKNPKYLVVVADPKQIYVYNFPECEWVRTIPLSSANDKRNVYIPAYGDDSYDERNCYATAFASLSTSSSSTVDNRKNENIVAVGPLRNFHVGEIKFYRIEDGSEVAERIPIREGTTVHSMSFVSDDCHTLLVEVASGAYESTGCEYDFARIEKNEIRLMKVEYKHDLASKKRKAAT